MPSLLTSVLILNPLFLKIRPQLQRYHDSVTLDCPTPSYIREYNIIEQNAKQTYRNPRPYNELSPQPVRTTG
jgi:hypothetical protein